MIRGVLSLVGMGIIFLLLIRTVQGEMNLADVAVRGLVIVVAITVIDKLVVPLVAVALRATTVHSDVDEPPERGPIATGDTGA